MNEISVKQMNNPHGQIYEDMPVHDHWSTYDMSLEGCRYNMLHGLVTATPFDQAAAINILAEIEALAQSKGYGDEDSYICGLGRYTEEEIEADPRLASQREMHQEDADAEYTFETRCSISLLRYSAATFEAIEFVPTILHVVEQARTRGAAMRRADNVKPSAPAPG
jgi:hypothetical protein